MKKIRIGNTIDFRYSLYKGSEPEDLTGIEVTTCLRNTLYRTVLDVTVTIEGNTLRCVIPGKTHARTGIYNFFVSYTKAGRDYAIDVDAFCLVDSSSKVGGTDDCSSVEAASVELSGVIEETAGGSLEQVQSDWRELNPESKAFIRNKPVLKPVATSGSYHDLEDAPETTYSKTEIESMIEDARLNVNLTPEQLASLNVDLTPITDELREINLYPVKGKRLLVLGDSLSDANSGTMDNPSVGQGWPKYAVEKLKLSDESRVIANGGATIRDKGETTLHTDKATLSASQNTLSNQVYMLLEHYKRNKGTANEFVPDVVIIMAGGNDISTSYPISNWPGLLGDWDAVMYNYVLEDADYNLLDLSNADDLTRYNRLRTFRGTLYGAYRWIIETILTNFPDTLVYAMPSTHHAGGRGKNLFVFREHVKKVAAWYGLPVIDVMGESGMSFFTETRRENGWDNNWYSFDGTHPNFAGRPLLGNYIAGRIRNTYYVKPPITAQRKGQDVTKTYYTITATTSNNDSAFGSITPPGVSQVEEGGSLTFAISANVGYRIAGILVDGEPVEIANSYTFSDVQADHTIIVTFEAGVIAKRKAIVSLGWYTGEDGMPDNPVFNAADGVTKVCFTATPRKFFDQNGNEFGTVANTTAASGTWYHNSNAPVTGNNSGVYIDDYAKRYTGYKNSQINTGSIHHMVLPNGNYKVSIYANGETTATSSDVRYYVVSDEATTSFAPFEKLKGNFTQKQEIQIQVTNGAFDIHCDILKAWVVVPLNVIEIEET